MQRVGNDYSNMMLHREREAFNDVPHLVREEMKTIAKVKGIDMYSVHRCKIDDFNTIICPQHLTKVDDSLLISVFNPNIKAVSGLNLSVPRKYSAVKVGVSRPRNKGDINQIFENVQESIELTCFYRSQ